MNSKPPTVETATTPPLIQTTGEYLSFRLGREEYGIDILNVQEIRGYDEPTRMFSAQPFVKGVMNLRGVIVPIIDMRIKFGLSEVVYDGLTVIIVLNIGQRVVGMVVDSVSDVIKLQATDIQPAPQCSNALETEHIIGLGTVQNGDSPRMLILLDIQKLMSSADMGLVSQAMH
ncbi:chemotaxis protein CheW [Rhodoferax lithotrophicus]|uniref:Chemotaxis protein CheW n=1 Tax=Rhodoferax lithotrophicus TaxID=2798804 RepID=A0ABM7MQP6_9BURK|nr:chemotaxis protein CheW [Rhodoferax sp. MIZ03]BCO28687.1 chemotaxis protein CheW [Rhodoferax sp. MIZ03]